MSRRIRGSPGRYMTVHISPGSISRSHLPVIPGVLEYPLRTDDGNRGLLGDDVSGLEGCAYNLIASARDNLGDEAHLQGLGGVKVSSRESDLRHEALVPCDLRETSQCTDISCQAKIDFLQKWSEHALAM